MLLHLPLTHAAPWPVEVAAPLPEPPSVTQASNLAIYAVYTTDSSDRLAALQYVLGVAGTPAWFDHLGGVARVVGGNRFACAFSDGGSTFHDDSESDPEVPMQPRRIDAVWDEADAVLFELGLFDATPFELFPPRVVRSEATVTVPSGRTFGLWTSSQIAVYGYRLDRYDVLGPGGETTVEFDGEGVIAVSDNHRSMEIAEVLVPDAPGVVLRRWADRAEVEHSWFWGNSLHTDVTADRYGMYTGAGYTLKTQAGHSSSYTGANVRFYSASCATSGDTAYSTSCDPSRGRVRPPQPGRCSGRLCAQDGCPSAEVF